jgi:hypothetical protein
MSDLRIPGILALAAGLLACPTLVDACCGLYVARTEANPYDRGARVVLARDGERTVMTVVNDYAGEPTEFAMLVPVPAVLERDQVHLGENAPLDRLDAYTAARLHEQFDPDPCQMIQSEAAARARVAEAAPSERRERTRGVRIESRYAIGEYEIVMPSAAQGAAPAAWLREEGYALSEDAAAMLASYVRRGMSFFLVKTTLRERTGAGYDTLRPLQVAFESSELSLPIRLDAPNVAGPRDLIIYALTRARRVEAANYPTVTMPTDVEVPAFVMDDPERFHAAVVDAQVARSVADTVFLEYAGDLNACDPCTADPPSDEELRALGVFWELRETEPQGVFSPDDPQRSIALPRARNVFVTRLRLRQGDGAFPEDLVLRETADRASFQSRYLLRHAWEGATACEAARIYQAGLPARSERLAQALADLTGEEVDPIRAKMGLEVPEPPPPSAERWWGRIWKD